MDTQNNIRQALEARQPQALQQMITFLTGKAGSETPGRKSSANALVAATIAQLFGGAVLTATLAVQLPQATPFAMVPLLYGMAVGMLATAGAVRMTTSVLLHHSTHNNFPVPKALASHVDLKTWNRFVGELLSTLSVVTPHKLYDEAHRLHHKQSILATINDPDWKFLAARGIAPGLSVRENKRRLVRALLSPRFHAEFLTDRLRDNLTNPETPLGRRAAAWVWGTLVSLALGATVAAYGPVALFLFALAWGVPVVILNQIGAVLQLITEHYWLRRPDSDNKNLVMDRKTRGRFTALPLPKKDSKLAWGLWWAGMVLWIAPVYRLWLLPGDLASHDWHHRIPGAKDFANAAYARRDALATADPRWPEADKEVWGFGEALNDVLGLLATITKQPDPLTPDERTELYRGM